MTLDGADLIGDPAIDPEPAAAPFQPPRPPYYAVIFTSQRGAPDPGYDAMADKMVAMAQLRPGFLGLDSARGADGFGITVSYWASEAAIRDWKADLDHMAAQRMGMASWYRSYALHVAKVERSYTGPEGRLPPE
ncbi:MAG: antibiotic biosynthesis monooxygenase [Rhodobacteraceae bacterium]|nr:antibiotic biosynthesis monooxygenase [Paracoccaceae bacterium]